MKSFRCEDVVPGCMQTFTGLSEGEILLDVAKHASFAHALPSLPATIVKQVCLKIRDVA